MVQKIKLICTPLEYYTQNDKNAMFEWIDRIKSIKKCEGTGQELHLYFDSNDIPREDLLDLIGLFSRYNFDLSQLKVFKNEANIDISNETRFFSVYPRKQ